MIVYDNRDKAVDKIFVKEYLRGRKNGLSIADAVRSATDSATSHLATLHEVKK